MVDAGDPNATGDVNVNINIPEADAEKLAEQTAKIKEAATNFRESAGQYSQMLGRLAESPGMKPPLPPEAEVAMEQGARAAGRLKKQFDSMRDSPGLSAVSSGLQNIVKDTGPMGKLIKSTFEGISRHADQFNKILSSGTALGALVGVEKVLGGIDNRTKVFSKLQQSLMDVHKYALQASMGIGEGFREAQGSVEDLQMSFGETMVHTKTLRKDVLAVGDVLKQAFSAREAFAGMEQLRDGTNKMRSAMNLANTAILVGAARGMDATKTAEMLAKAHLNLGESVESAALIFGEIDQAAQDSGMQFAKVADLIVGAADSMKMWGGTVSSVTPTFKAFSDALGEGRKGLVEPLFQKYMAGLKDMEFEMRALIGITAGMGGPGGGAGTAIGAGLQMEALMEQGAEGMGQVSEQLIGTIKNLTGGQMLTREQALENPALENQFMIQRQLLQQMTKTSTDEATQMMEILQNIDENGIENTENAKERLNEMMKSGEDTRKATTNDMVDATLKVEGAINTQGKEITNAINSLMKRSGARRVVAAAQRTTERMATGKIGGIQGVKEFMQSLGAEDMFKTISQKVAGLTGQKVTTKEEQADVKLGQRSAVDAVNRLMGELVRKRDATIAGERGGFQGMQDRAGVITKMAAGQGISTKFVKKDIQGVVKGIEDEIQRLKDLSEAYGGPTQATAAKLETLKAAKRQMEQMSKQKTINLAEFGEAKQYQKYEMPPEIKRRIPAAPTPAGVTAAPDPLALARQRQIDRQLPDQRELKRRQDAAQERLNELKAQGENLEEAPGRVRKMVLPPLKLPVREAQQATRETRDIARTPQQAAAPETVEKKIALKIIPDRQTVTIEVDERKMREIARDETDGILER